MNVAELKERGTGVSGGGGEGRETGEETVVRDGVAYRWALMPLSVAGQGHSQNHGQSGFVQDSGDIQMTERRRDVEEGNPVTGPSHSTPESEGLVIGRAATPLRESFERGARHGGARSEEDGGDEIHVVRR